MVRKFLAATESAVEIYFAMTAFTALRKAAEAAPQSARTGASFVSLDSRVLVALCDIIDYSKDTLAALNAVTDVELGDDGSRIVTPEDMKTVWAAIEKLQPLIQAA